MNKTIEETLETIDKMLAIPKAQMYWAAQREYEREKEVDKVRELFGDDIIENILKINDDYWIVELKWKNQRYKPTWFSIVANDKRISGEAFNSLDYALLAVVNHMISGDFRAVYWAAKLMTKEAPNAQESRS
jgi:hypothetical protein